MDGLLSQLRDIRGIDAVSWWPPAPGWWGLALLLLALGAALHFYRYYRKRQAAGWRAEIRSRLAALSADNDVKTKAAALSELLRLLAIHRYGRDSCAGLEGKTWLAWLAAHDPAGFDWQANAQILIEAPYAPHFALKDNDITPLIKAAERWMKG